MSCHESIDRFDEYLEGRLDPAAAEAIRAHLSGCQSCADELEALRDLRDRIAALPHSLEPARDLWPGIANRLSAENVVRGRFGRRALLAAAAALVVVTSVVTAYFIGRSQAVTTATTPNATESGASEILLASFEGLGVTGYQMRRAELLDALEARRHELSPETMEVVTENLLLIDRAMDRIAEALDNDPENELLMRQLAGTYRRQIDLLQRAVRLPSEI